MYWLDGFNCTTCTVINICSYHNYVFNGMHMNTTNSVIPKSAPKRRDSVNISPEL